MRDTITWLMMLCYSASDLDCGNFSTESFFLYPRCLFLRLSKNMDKYAWIYIFTVEIIFDRKTSNNVVLDSAFTVKHRLHIFCHGWNLQEMGLIQASQAILDFQLVQLRQCFFFSPPQAIFWYRLQKDCPFPLCICFI